MQRDERIDTIREARNICSRLKGAKELVAWLCARQCFRRESWRAIAGRLNGEHKVIANEGRFCRDRAQHRPDSQQGNDDYNADSHLVKPPCVSARVHYAT